MTSKHSDHYGTLNAVLGAIAATHDQDRERVNSLLAGLDLGAFVSASLGLNEMLIAQTASRANVAFDVFLGRLRSQLLDLEHDE